MREALRQPPAARARNGYPHCSHDWHAERCRVGRAGDACGSVSFSRDSQAHAKEILMKNESHRTMRAVAIDEFGGIETMKRRELPVPEVATDEILSRGDTTAAAVRDPVEREGGLAKEFARQRNCRH